MKPMYEAGISGAPGLGGLGAGDLEKWNQNYIQIKIVEIISYQHG